MKLFLPLAVLLAGACASPRIAPPRSYVRDLHSHAEPGKVRVTHVDLDLTLDFEAKTVAGTAELDLARSDLAAPLVLDAVALEIASVSGSDGMPRRFELSPPDARIGSALTIELQPKDDSVAIRYHTTEKSEALQWLTKEQTAGGKQPFLFTQGQAILTRTWIPLQDTPQVRVTYEAHVRAPEGLTVLMSADQKGRDRSGAFRFEMDRAIPPYLIALACGELEFRPISKRTGVWAEPNVVARAKDEFADTEKMVAAAEQLFGPYRWERYEILILPPSFPFGGMENPRLTFATPTVIAGDRSLVALIAHELAHSWAGNLVTNATWSDFWLNEGFTTYLENRIMEELYGKERADTELALEIVDLEQELEDLEPWAEVLHTDLAGRHPDDGFSQVPYVKGALFVKRLETLFGRERTDAFLNHWFDSHAFESVTTTDLVDDLESGLFAEEPDRARSLDLGLWLHQPGLPPDAPRPTSDLLLVVDRELASLARGTPPGDLATQGWITHQWLRFIEGLPDDTSAADMAELDAAFHFTDSGNSEILCAWLVRSIRHGYAGADERLDQFLMNVGRRKFLKPLYAELAKTPAGLERARTIYASARPRYHAVSANTLDGVLGVTPSE